MEFDKEIEELHKQKTKLVKCMAIVDNQIKDYIKNCKHKTIKQGKNGWAITICRKCGKHFGWYCKENKKHYCEYDEVKDPVCDDCIYCHQPEERK